MFKRSLEIVQKLQPTSTIGIVTHTYYWLTSSSGDLVYKNPSFNKNKIKNNETAIYFIHGTADQSAAFIRIAERMIETGLPNVISSLNLLAFDQRYQGMSIESFAEQLKNKISANQHHRVILIAHSRGGLVAAYFAEYIAKLVSIEVVLTIPICSPFNGSYLAIKPLTFFSESIKEMKIDSAFLDKLRHKILSNAEARYHFFIAKDDMIVPGDAGFIKEYVEKFPDSLTKLNEHGHLSIMSSHKIVLSIAHLISILFDPPEVLITQFAELNIIEDYIPKKN